MAPECPGTDKHLAPARRLRQRGRRCHPPIAQFLVWRQRSGRGSPSTRLRALSKSHSRGTRRNGPSHPEGLLSSASFACPHTQATITHCTPVIIPWPLIASLFSSQHDQKRQPYPLLLVCVTTYWPTPGPVHAMTKTRNGRTRQSTRAGRKEVAGSE
mgnify:CR=1 FL=1